ncbi:MAG TPA: hypothetical protein VHZ26_09970 [Caulobacteraceae bacterium]|jgi:hypothetical protein|nr:hypothetical protein [Caulobacteraceae bacterium]
MKHSPLFRTTALASVAVAVLVLGACNRNGAANSSQNGAYVAASSLPESGAAPLPPSNEYQRVADTPPPPMPVYDQPPIPGPGYVWTPGYWDWSDSDEDYYWVPGTWVEPPSPGLYWTPGYWRYYDGRYLYSDGYWGPDVGFYGGVDYGYGYEGRGYAGGRWQGDRFYYNSQVNNFGGRHLDTVYSQDVSAAADNRASYNGGPGGLRVVPAPADVQAAQARHLAPTRSQTELARTARVDPQLRASVNRGAPPIAATARPQLLHGGRAGAAAAGVTAARSAGEYTPPQRQGPPRSPLAAPVSGLAAGGPRHQAGPQNGAFGGQPLEPGRTAERHARGPTPFAPAQPNAAAPVRIEPQVHQPQLREPQVRQPQIREPQVREPQIREPQIRQPQIRQPPMQAPQMRAPAFARPTPEARAPQAMRAPPAAAPPVMRAPPVAVPHAAGPHPAPAGKGPQPDRH